MAYRVARPPATRGASVNAVPSGRIPGVADSRRRRMLDNVEGTWRSRSLAETIEKIEAELDLAWVRLLGEWGVAPGSAEETALAWLVVDAPEAHDWRVVDAALDRLTCTECGATLARGPATCRRCAYHHELRFAARETDRPHVPPGNEHAIRVSFAVARNRSRYRPRARVGYELTLPDLVAGGLPTTKQAQATKALINKLTPEECDSVTSIAEVEALARTRRQIAGHHILSAPPDLDGFIADN